MYYQQILESQNILKQNLNFNSIDFFAQLGHSNYLQQKFQETLSTRAVDSQAILGEKLVQMIVKRKNWFLLNYRESSLITEVGASQVFQNGLCKLILKELI